MTKIVDIGDECVGCGTCVELCPSLFYFDEDKMKARVLDDHSVSEEELEEAIQSCPVQCISLMDQDCSRCETCSHLCVDVLSESESGEMVEVIPPEGSLEDCLESGYEYCDDACSGCDSDGK